MFSVSIVDGAFCASMIQGQPNRASESNFVCLQSYGRNADSYFVIWFYLLFGRDKSVFPFTREVRDCSAGSERKSLLYL